MGHFKMTLERFFEENPAGGLALSGGVDSSFLAWAAGRYGQNWRTYYVRSAFQPAFELDDAQAVSKFSGVPLTVIEADILSHEEVAANSQNRCYFCKRVIFSQILERAAADGLSLVIDGTNASDNADDRPGMRALRELSVRSPLRECGLTKADVRERSRSAGLFTWNKPSYACLATRVPAGTKIEKEALQRVEQGESLVASLGFSGFRLRLRGELALLQFPEDQLASAFARRHELQRILEPLFSAVSIDLKPHERAG